MAENVHQKLVPSLLHLMRAFARAHAITRTTSLMRVKNSTRHLGL